jgi:hypothetical protein
MDTPSKRPPEVAEAALKIIEAAVLSIRAAAWNEETEYCAIEADHIHNLPGLITDFTPSRLSYYLGIERRSYIKQMEKLGSLDTRAYEDPWKQLEKNSI